MRGLAMACSPMRGGVEASKADVLITHARSPPHQAEKSKRKLRKRISIPTPVPGGGGGPPGTAGHEGDLDDLISAIRTGKAFGGAEAGSRVRGRRLPPPRLPSPDGKGSVLPPPLPLSHLPEVPHGDEGAGDALSG